MAPFLAGVLVLGSSGDVVGSTARNKAKPRRSDAERRAQLAAAPLTIAKKPGSADGEAQLLVDGHVQKIAPHVLAAWKVRQGAAVLAILRLPHGEQRLRYYDLDTSRRRDLGPVPFREATLAEGASGDGRWAFTLSGAAPDGSPLVLVGGVEAVPGVLPKATDPHFLEGGTLRFIQDGTPRDAKVGMLLGTDLRAIYQAPPAAGITPKYLQVFPEGHALVQLDDGAVAHGTWTTDGSTLHVHKLSSSHGQPVEYAAPLTALEPVQGVPAGQRFGVRLTEALSSRHAHEGQAVHAVSITPVVVGGAILIPAGSALEGQIVQADSVGWGFKHETASLTVHWTRVTPPGAAALPLQARVFTVENAQEKTTDGGKIQGIRSTGTIGSSAENGVLSLAGIDPVAYTFATASGSAVLGFAEPEILYPGGTELILETTSPLITSQVFPPSVLPSATTAPAQEALLSLVRGLPFRTATKGSDKPSDLTNLVFIGSEQSLERAFTAAGWLPTDDLYAASTFRTVKTLSGNETYTQAPMSVLLLNEKPPLLTLSKTTNTFASRHHLRIFPTDSHDNGATVLTASSTQDIAIAFSRRQKTFIHVIDEHIDNERSKVINDLVFTGCVDSLDLVPRPWVPRDAYNSTGDELLTDGAAAVLRINSCTAPRTTPHTPAPAPSRMERSTRNTSLTIRNSLYRGNLIYQGISSGFRVHKFLHDSNELPADPGDWRKTDASGTDYKGRLSGAKPGEEEETANNPFALHRRPEGEGPAAPTEADRAAIAQARLAHRWDPPRYEFALHGGYLHMRSSYLSAVGVLETSSVPTANAYFLFLADDVGDGWAAGGSVTVNSWKHFSNEFSYFRQQVKYQLGSVDAVLPPDQNTILDDSDLSTERIGLVTRQFEYNLLLHPTRPTSRLRPYAAVGPVLQLVALNGAPLNKPAGVFTLGLKSIGLLKSAFDFGNTPPLDGGGIFHLGLQYGAGVKYRVTPRLMLRADWRETWAKNPDIIAQSYEDYDSAVLDDTYTTQVIRVGPEKKFIKDRYTLGVAFTF